MKGACSYIHLDRLRALTSQGFNFYVIAVSRVNILVYIVRVGFAKPLTLPIRSIRR